MELKLFPIPKSGEFRIALTGPDSFDVECKDMDTADYQRMYGFFCQMAGRWGEFRFEYADTARPRCVFDSDSPSFVSDGPNRHSVTLPIKVLR